MPAKGEPGEVQFQLLENGETRIDLELSGHSVSRLYIIPLTIAVGVARVRVDGIGGVETDEEYRHRGYARRVMEAALSRMRGDDGIASLDPAALSFLFGISNFYERFGYVPAGPWYSLHIELASRKPMPSGWTVRPCRPPDLPAIHALYERVTARTVGSVIRYPTGRVWSALANAVADPHRDECRIVASPGGVVAAYAWRGRDFWPVDDEEDAPDALVIGEALAEGPLGADALIAACQAWAIEESARRPQITRVQISLSPDNPVYAAAMRHEAKLETSWTASGGFMARTLRLGRLFEALAPELSQRLWASANATFGPLRIVTDIGEATLDIAQGKVTVRQQGEASRRFGAPAIHLSQQDMTRLVFGACPTGDLLDRLGSTPEDRTRRWLEILFPRRHPYTHLPDWV